MQNWRLDDILSSQSNNMRLVEGLKLLKQRATLGSLASSDDLEFAELCQFRQISRLEIEDTITGIEPFPGEIMSTKRMNVALPNDIYDILVEYYNNAYDSEFVTIAKAATERSGDRIVVQPQVNQFGRIQVRSEIFGSVNAPRYLRSSFIRAKFVQENDSIEVFPGQVQYYFEHEVNRKIHRLAYVRWFKSTPNHQMRDRKSTRLNSSHGSISYAVFCLKKKKKKNKLSETHTKNAVTSNHKKNTRRNHVIPTVNTKR